MNESQLCLFGEEVATPPKAEVAFHEGAQASRSWKLYLNGQRSFLTVFLVEGYDDISNPRSRLKSSLERLSEKMNGRMPVAVLCWPHKTDNDAFEVAGIFDMTKAEIEFQEKVRSLYPRWQ